LSEKNGASKYDESQKTKHWYVFYRASRNFDPPSNVRLIVSPPGESVRCGVGDLSRKSTKVGLGDVEPPTGVEVGDGEGEGEEKKTWDGSNVG